MVMTEDCGKPCSFPQTVTSGWAFAAKGSEKADSAQLSQSPKTANIQRIVGIMNRSNSRRQNGWQPSSAYDACAEERTQARGTGTRGSSDLRSQIQISEGN